MRVLRVQNLDAATLAIRAKYRSSTWCFFAGVLVLLGLAVLAPIVSVVVEWLPPGETCASWFQRSGAVTTLFSILAGALAVITSGRLHTPGTFGDQNKLEVLKEFKKRFVRAESTLLVTTVVGTVIWGYGDLLTRWLIL